MLNNSKGFKLFTTLTLYYKLSLMLPHYSFKVKSKFLFLFLFYALLSYSQELPPIQFFSPQDYAAGDQNWDIAQANDKTIYVANNKGLLEFNGSNWRLYSLENQTVVRSVKVIDNKIYTGSYMDFGFWRKNDLGLLEYASLKNKLKLDLVEDEEFWEILGLEDWILFQSFDRIYIYNKLNDDINIIESDARIGKMYKVNDAIYFQKMFDGIYKIENGDAKIVSQSPIIKNNEIINVFDQNSSLLIQTRENGFYNLVGNEFKKWKIGANDLLSQLSIYSSIRLKDNSFILGSISNGIVQLNSGGQAILQIGQAKGLGNNTVLDTFEDTEGNVWLALDNGVNVININSPYKVYKDKLGVLGTIYSSALIDNYLYLGTNQGLFYKKINEDSEFKFVKGTNGQVWSLAIVDGVLLCGHDNGTFLISGTTSNLISGIKGTWCFKKIPGHPNLLLQGNYKGLNVLENTDDGKWTFRNKISGFDISSRYVEFVNENELLVSHEYKGVYRLTLGENFSRVESTSKLNIDKSINSSLQSYKGEILYAYNKGIFKYSENTKSFEKDSTLSTIFSDGTYVSGKLIKGRNDDRIWGFSNRELAYVQPGKLTETPTINRIALPSDVRKAKTGFEDILLLGENEYLLGTKEGYIVIDLKKIEEASHNIHLNHITYNEAQNPSAFLNINEAAELPNKSNNVSFSYSVPVYNQFSPVLYQYRLVGIYDAWSNWSTKSEAVFENLPHGEYSFEARAKIKENLSENIISYKFSIEKPWYLKPLALIIYALLFGLITFLIQYLNRRYYKKQKQELLEKKQRELELKESESKRQLIQFKNQNLKQDIENKNRELGISTMNLIKKNELLNSIKKELKAAGKLEDLKAVIKLINKNLNTTQDWKLFEEAFNNADKDFLKKVKSKHPSLTSNDLRLCAYLRLNLSSKEIAPLLNISPRSVEVKRYRLRKKMDLPHELNLTSYILGI